MRSLRSHEGVFLMDHSQGPGVPDEVVLAQGLEAGAGQGKYEGATYTCNHCEAVVHIENRRTRPRGYCKKCDHYVCDDCEAIRFQSGGACYPFKAKVTDIQEKIDKGMDPMKAFQSIILLS